jgi:hypothetical protein
VNVRPDIQKKIALLECFHVSAACPYDKNGVETKGRKYFVASSCPDWFGGQFIGVLGAFYPGVKHRCIKLFYSSVYSANVKIEWICTSTLPYIFTMCAVPPLQLSPTGFLDLMNHSYFLVEIIFFIYKRCSCSCLTLEISI